MCNSFKRNRHHRSFVLYFVFVFVFVLVLCRSYLSFHLASEHHKFYMKLRDSIISIQHISSELNIPISSVQCTTKATDIFPSDYEMTRTEKLAAAATGSSTTSSPKQQQPSNTTFAENNIKLIDKCSKTSAGIRARNVKKSMLNRLLRRSKSTVGLSSKKDGQEYATNHSSGDCNSKEEHQNKENEQPKSNRINYESVDKITLTPPKIMSPNRNRVKMGTRVFSSQFLNKSLDNIYDNAMSVYDLDADFDNHPAVKCKLNSLQTDDRCSSQQRRRQNYTSDGECLDGCTTDSSITTKRCTNDYRYLSSTTDVDRLSLKSSSLSSTQCSEKLGDIACDPLPNTEAYVIRKWKQKRRPFVHAIYDL